MSPSFRSGSPDCRMVPFSPTAIHRPSPKAIPKSSESVPKKCHCQLTASVEVQIPSVPSRAIQRPSVYSTATMTPIAPGEVFVQLMPSDDLSKMPEPPANQSPLPNPTLKRPLAENELALIQSEPFVEARMVPLDPTAHHCPPPEATEFRWLDVVEATPDQLMPLVELRIIPL